MFLERSSPHTEQNQPDHTSFSSDFLWEACDRKESWDREEKQLKATEQVRLFLAIFFVCLFYNLRQLVQHFFFSGTSHTTLFSAKLIWLFSLLHP